jgi:4-hydroxy-4-methyl-2-oxoglutarate aldolase
MAAYDYNDTDWAAIKRLSKWYSGDIHDVLDGRGPYGYLKGVTQFGVLHPGQVICGPVSTVCYEPSTRTGQPQDIYHGAIDAVVKGGILMVDSSCAEGSGTGELMSSGAKTKGAAATVVNGTVRDLAEVRKLDYPLFAKGMSPVGVSGRMEPAHYQVELDIDGVKIRPGDVIFADVTGVVVIPAGLVGVIADAADANGEAEIRCRQRILLGEDLRAIWPVGATGPV